MTQPNTGVTVRFFPEDLPTMDPIKRAWLPELIDRSEWREGPWDAESDYEEWEDEDTGLPCVAYRGPVGAWCGYVGVDAGHPYYKVDYSSCPVQCENYQEGDAYCEHRIEGILEVHGGVTYTGWLQHVHGDQHRAWFIGFDCSHWGDLSPKAELLWKDTGAYRDLAYVREQCNHLAIQLRVIEDV